MKIQFGYIEEVNREDTNESDRWHFISESNDKSILLHDFIEWLNDCDDDKVTGINAEELSQIWFRIMP
jgi:hypothetical protein